MARIPNETIINDNAEFRNFANELSAAHPDAVFSPEENLAKVRVMAAVIMEKEVSAPIALPGESVFYTLTLHNNVDFGVLNIRLTDTLECKFHYIQMIDGPEPLAGYSYNPVVWENLSVGAGQTTQLIFEVYVAGPWTAKCYNNLNATSPDVYIPARTKLARVIVQPPVGITKAVLPSEIFANTTVTYTVGLYNYSLTQTYSVVRVQDYLYDGFYPSPGIIVPPAPVPIPPGGGTWQGRFQTLVSADPVICQFLPESYKNLPFAIDVTLNSPETGDIHIYNATSLAPLKVNPNVQVDLVPYRYAVQPGGIFTYTLHLNNVSPSIANNSQITLIIPEGFTYIDSVGGPPPNSVILNTLKWNALDIPALTEVVSAFRVQVPADIDLGAVGSKTFGSSFTANSQGVCFGQLGSGNDPLGIGNMLVAYDIVLLKKKALNADAGADSVIVAPLGLVDYEISLQSKDKYDMVLPVITDTMPSSPGLFSFNEMLIGPAPSSIVGKNILWQNYTLYGGVTTKWRVRLQAGPLYGVHDNYVDAELPDEPAFTMGLSNADDDPSVDVQPVFDLQKEVDTGHESANWAFPGDTIVYTISMVNLSATAYGGIRVTDTLPANFTFLNMAPGQLISPVSVSPDGTQIIWDGLNLGTGCPGGCVLKLVFLVKVGESVQAGTYYNTVLGFSPSGSIPGPISDAPVSIATDGVIPTPTMTPTPGPSPTPTLSPTPGPSPTPTQGGGGPTVTPGGPTVTPGPQTEHLYLPNVPK